MATTNVTVANQALRLLRATPVVSTFNDGSAAGNILLDMYDDHIKALFSMYPWTFATKKALLVADATSPVNEYKYSHEIPAEAMLVWAVFNSSLVGARPVVDYDMYGSETERFIFSNYPTLYADYTIDRAEAVWPYYFVQFAVHSLAAHIAMPVTGNMELADYWYRKAYGSANANGKGGFYGIATSTDSKQKRNEYIISSPLTEARFS